MDKDVSFHDNTIHSIEYIDENYGTTLILDIDHIVEWIQTDEECQFKVAPAKLYFLNVGDMEIRINKPGFTIGSYLETILGITSASLSDNRESIIISLLDNNYIKFSASSHRLEVTGNGKVKPNQRLTVAERTIS